MAKLDYLRNVPLKVQRVYFNLIQTNYNIIFHMINYVSDLGKEITKFNIDYFRIVSFDWSSAPF